VTAAHSKDDVEVRVAGLIDVMARFAAGDWEARAPRDKSGDPWDVLAYMINATIEELGEEVLDRQQQEAALRATQAQLLHSEKLAALGELAGGIAHELNQPLTVIRMLLDLTSVSGGPATPEDLRTIGTSVDQMSRIVDGVRIFARRQPVMVEDLDARSPVEAALELMGPALRNAGIELRCALPDDLPMVKADAGRLQQVMVNLLANARDALLKARRDIVGHVAVEARHVDGFVEYTVEDDGEGVPPESRNTVFEPFFTTKPAGLGTGLGLSISFGIVEEHGGTIQCGSSRSGGARFVVRIPCACGGIAGSGGGG
jgi:C4-dicarboxylate-specific signal transduction histidine kinase